MTDYGTIKIPKDEYDRHNAKRKNLGDSWAEYIDGQAPDAVEGLAELQDAVATIEERTGRIERTLEELEGRR